MNDLTTTGGVLPPAPSEMTARRKEGHSIAERFMAGVQESFPTISFKGKEWAFKYQGAISRVPDRHLDVVLADASAAIAKVFYIKGYAEGDTNPPDCWSIDGVKPDPSVPHRQSPTCPGCKQNVFGSKITPAGKQAKACQDSRRVAIALPHDLGQNKVGSVMLRVPQSSLRNLREYIAMLNAHGYDPNGCVTRMSFDQEAAFPKLKFTFHAALSNEQYRAVLEVEQHERTKRMLSAPITGAASEELDEESAGEVRSAATAQEEAPAVPTPPPVAEPPKRTAAEPPPQPEAPANGQGPLSGVLAAAAAPAVPPPEPPATSNLGGPMSGANVVNLPGMGQAEAEEKPKPRGRPGKAAPAKEQAVQDAPPGLENLLASMLPPT